jgi:hypothetical protein
LAYRHQGIRASGHRASGHQGIRASGHQGIGYQGIRTSGHQGIRDFGARSSPLLSFPLSATIAILWQLLHEKHSLYLFYRYIRCFILILSIMIDDLRKLSIVEYR